MSTTFEQKQVLVKTLKKAVNSFVYSPSEEKKANLSEAMASLNSFIDGIDIPPPPKKEAKKKPSKASKSKSTKSPKTSKSKPSKKSLTSKDSDRKSEIEALLSSDKKMKRAERSVLNKELFALQTKERPTSSSKRKSKAVRRPKRTSEDGLELTQAKTATANRVGKVKKTKVVHAITEGDAMPFEPRKEVPVVEPKVRKKEFMKVTLLEGETPQEAMARLRSAQIEAARLEAEALIADTAPF
jgi:hypothetical protein